MKCVDFKFKYSSQDQTTSHNATLLIPSLWWHNDMATFGPHVALHGTGSTIMPLQINMRATCGPWPTSGTISIINPCLAVTWHSIMLPLVAVLKTLAANCGHMWPTCEMFAG